MLAHETGGFVTALDTHRPYLHELGRRARAAGLEARINAQHGSMENLSFEDESFELIWSEGAIYNIGFDRGLTEWRRLLIPNGSLAVTELTWLEPEAPDQVRAFWQEGYPAMRSVEDNLVALERAG